MATTMQTYVKPWLVKKAKDAITGKSLYMFRLTKPVNGNLEAVNFAIDEEDLKNPETLDSLLNKSEEALSMKHNLKTGGIQDA